MAEKAHAINLADYVGQQHIVIQLREQIKGAKALGQPLSSKLLLGNPGLGKTQLAESVAREIGTQLHKIIGTKRISPMDLAQRAAEFKPFDVLFVDEIHATSSAFQEALQRLIDGFIPEIYDDPLSGKKRIKGEVAAPAITLFGATDRPGLLLKALKSRFGSPLALKPYTMDEMKQIVRFHSCEATLILTDNAISILATASKGIPRFAWQQIRALREHAAARSLADITDHNVRDVLSMQGYDAYGLNELDRNYLSLLNDTGAVGAKLTSLASILSTDATYIQRDIEPALQQLGFLIVDGRRFITVKGAAYLRRAGS